MIEQTQFAAQQMDELRKLIDTRVFKEPAYRARFSCRSRYGTMRPRAQFQQCEPARSGCTAFESLKCRPRTTTLDSQDRQRDGKITEPHQMVDATISRCPRCREVLMWRGPIESLVRAVQ